MKLSFKHNGEDGLLYAHDCQTHDAHDLSRKLSSFIYSHRSHVLREHHRESKAADPFVADWDVSTECYQKRYGIEVALVPLINFYGTVEDINTYLDIIAKEFNVEIERIAQGENNV